MIWIEFGRNNQREESEKVGSNFFFFFAFDLLLLLTVLILSFSSSIFFFLSSVHYLVQYPQDGVRASIEGFSKMKSLTGKPIKADSEISTGLPILVQYTDKKWYRAKVLDKGEKAFKISKEDARIKSGEELRRFEKVLGFCSKSVLPERDFSLYLVSVEGQEEK